MLEWLAAATGIELGKLVLEQVLNLGKAAMEDYVKDFFKGCLKGSAAWANAEALKKPMAEAIGFFIKRFVKELQINGVLETSIEHHYKVAIKRFVQDKAVLPILGNAFEKDCKQIDYVQLERLWVQQYQVAGWQFPTEEFDWRGVGKEYVYEVKGIVKANAELRSLLEAELLEDIARNTAQISPGFDVVGYRESLQCSYGYLKLYTLDSTDRVDAIKLWSMFIEQTVREALPPMRYELPLDLKRKLQEEGQLGDDLSPEALELYRREYFQQPARKVLEAVADAQRVVVLGDPGSGKSSLLQYLALEWVEGKTETLPLLIELREFALTQARNFLDFLQHGRGVDWQFDQQQLHQHLLEFPTLVMFDGLDEVFDRATQSTVIDDIIRFSQQYPKARVLVTSRIIGYNPERLQHSGFRHFTLQSLDTDEIHAFIDRWYDLSMGSDSDKARLKQRLKDAIANSKAIQNLADNPLLLTMMAILNRRQELPRDRADLYDQASRVLLYHWDVDHKRLQLPIDTIGRREKQEMLCLVAYEMQAGEDGLKGNLISAERLTRVLTNYLRDQGFGEPREKANLLIQQLRERNFILCYRGADTYGFVHRTFLEYYCAMEIVSRFEKQRSLSFGQLKHEVFGQYWQDEAWHEVLRLICGIIDPIFVGDLVEFLLESNSNQQDFRHIFMATECISEVSSKSLIKKTSDKLLTQLKQLAEYGESSQLEYALGYVDDLGYKSFQKLDTSKYKETCILVRYAAVELVAKVWKEDQSTFEWLKECANSDSNWVAVSSSIQQLSQDWKNELETFLLIKNASQLDVESAFSNVQETSLGRLVKGWPDSPETLEILKKCAVENKNFRGRWRALWELSKCCKSQSDDLFMFLSDCAVNDPFDPLHYSNRNPRQAAIQTILKCYSSHPHTLTFLMNRAENDLDAGVRDFIISRLSIHWREELSVFNFLCKRAIIDPYETDKVRRTNPRKTALESLLICYSSYPKTFELLRDRAINDPDPQLREWAQQQLEQWEQKN